MSNYNMKQWVADLVGNHPKKPMPILSFPSVSLLGVGVRELISDSTLQARGMQAVAEKTPAAASVSFMDLSVEAECFGATVTVTDDEVPTIKGRIINDADEAEALASYPTEYYTCHCTGLQQYETMKEIMGSRLQYLAAGACLEVEEW